MNIHSISSPMRQLNDDRNRSNLEEIINDGADFSTYLNNIKIPMNITEQHEIIIKKLIQIRPINTYLDQISQETKITKQEAQDIAVCRFFDDINKQIELFNKTTQWKDEELDIFGLPERHFFETKHEEIKEKKDNGAKKKNKHIEDQLKANIWL